MSLLTRCAHCQTVFRITPEQLQAHGGQVRCGKCMQVFNGVAALVPETEASTSTAAMAAPAPKPPAPVEPVVPESPPAVEETGGAPIEAAAEASAELPESQPDASGPETETESEAEPEPESDPATAAELPDTTATDPANPFIHDVPEEVAAAPGARRPWLAAACVLLGMLLAAQAVFFYRGDIAARHPLARQWLTAACAQLGCSLPLPQASKALLIEASDLQLLDPARPDRIQLTATLRNHAGHDVAYPALDLVLTNANDHTLARRIFLPAEYLGGRDASTGIAANAELTVRVGLETGDLVAAGFRLAVLPAPR